MADTSFVLSRGYDAAAAITKFRAVKFTTAETTVTPVTAATDFACGVSEFDCTAADILRGKGVNVIHLGIATMEASAAITVGQAVGFGTDGRAKPIASTERYFGICVGNPAGGAGERVSVLILVGGGVAP